MNLKTIVALSLVLCYTVTGGQVNLTVQVRGLRGEKTNRSTSGGTEKLNVEDVTAWNNRPHLLSDWILVVSQAVIRQHEPVLLPLQKPQRKIWPHEDPSPSCKKTSYGSSQNTLSANKSCSMWTKQEFACRLYSYWNSRSPPLSCLFSPLMMKLESDPQLCKSYRTLQIGEL